MTSDLQVTQRTVLVDDDPTFLVTLKQLLSLDQRFDVVNTFPTGEEVVEFLADSPKDKPPWDLALVDLGLPGMDGVETTRQLCELCPTLKVSLLTVYDDSRKIAAAIVAGAKGYITKAEVGPNITELLNVLEAGGSPISPAVALALAEEVNRTRNSSSGPEKAKPSLTDQERIVLQGLAAGHSYKTLARDMGIAIDTVRFHVRSLYRKLQVHSAAEAVARGFGFDLL